MTTHINEPYEHDTSSMKAEEIKPKTVQIY